MNNKFRLEYLLFKDSKEFPRTKYEFVRNENIKCKAPYTTLIIGQNGTGKSRLLRAILDIMNDIYMRKVSPMMTTSPDLVRPFYDVAYDISYFIGDKNYVVTYDGYDFELQVDGISGHFSDVALPDKGIVAAYSLHENFTPKDKSILRRANKNRRVDNDFYEYLGIKSQSNFAFASANITKSIDLITAAVSESGFNKDLFKVFKTLKFNPAITVDYQVKKNRELFTGILTVNELRDKLKKADFQRSGFSFTSISSLRDSTDDAFLSDVTDSLNAVALNFEKSFKFSINISFENNYNNHDLSRMYKHISLLRKLNLLSYGKISVYKENRNKLFGSSLELRSMSSGEIHLITSLLSLAAVVKENSLILIDEPEISLHPNWQIKYMDLINEIFKSSRGCHFIVASHSHFLASSLRADSSSILALKESDDGEVRPLAMDSAYGWLAENVLYNVFGVATTRNYYFEMDLNELLKLISDRSDDIGEIKRLIGKFSSFKSNNNDPLRLLIKEAQMYVDSRELN